MKIVNRIDISDWVIHFVHDRNIVNEDISYDEDGEINHWDPNPNGYKFSGEPLYLENPLKEEENAIEYETEAYWVLLKILKDGYIKSSWSYRNNKATIYGHKQAVCFTEMPLYGLIEYAKERNTKSVGTYGIAILKKDLFKAGGRSVIYGLSGTVSEAKPDDLYYNGLTRNLSSQSGLGLKEQYRYVATNLNRIPYPIDWMHEREWRWADIKEVHEVPGLPLIIINPDFLLSKIVIIVKTIKEVEDILDNLQYLFHSTSDGFEHVFYSPQAIASISILATDEITKYSINPDTTKLEDLPLHILPKIAKANVKPETLQLISELMTEASEISLKASNEFYKKYGDNDLSGYCHLVTSDASSEVTQALIDLRFAKAYGDGYYHIYDLQTHPCHSLNVKEAGIKAGAKFLEENLNQTFRFYSRLD